MQNLQTILESVEKEFDEEIGLPSHEHDSDCFEDCPYATVEVKVEDAKEFLRQSITRAVEAQREVVIGSVEEMPRYPDEAYLAHRDQWNGGHNSCRNTVLEALEKFTVTKL